MQSLSNQFDQIAKRYAKRNAIHDDRGRLSFADLRVMMEHVANQLKSHNIQPGDSVAVSLPHCRELVISLLAILHCGAVYLPLDRKLSPQQRIALLDTMNPVIVISDNGWSDCYLDHGYTVLYIHDELEAKQPWMLSQPRYHQNCIVRTTSGSTGEPKLVIVPQHNIIDRLNWYSEIYGGSCDDNYAVKTSLGFVDSVVEILSPLLTGGSVSIINPDNNAIEFCQQLVKYQVTHLYCVPSLLNAILQYVDSSILASLTLKQCLVGGELLSPALATLFKRRLPTVQLVNLYGTTEAADICYYNVAEPIGDSIPLGKPLSHVNVYIVDESLNPVEIGQSGELCLSARGLMNEYVQRDDQSARSFTSNPFANKDGLACLYCTGDMVYQDQHGLIYYLGRRDNQLQYRGQLLAPELLENAMKSQGSVSNVAISCQTDDQGVQQLVAHVEYKQANTALNALAWQQYLRALLHDKTPMPTYYNAVDCLPLTNTGKLDRKNIQPVTISTANWQDWLNQLGGLEIIKQDSLLTLQLMQNIEQQYQIDISVPEFEAASTEQDLQILIASSNKKTIMAIGESRSSLSMLQQSYHLGETHTLPCAGITAKAYYLYQLNDLDLTRLTLALNALIKQIAALRAYLHDKQWQFVTTNTTYIPDIIVLSHAIDHAEAANHFYQQRYNDSLSSDQWPLFRIRYLCSHNKTTMMFESALLLFDEHSVLEFIRVWLLYYHAGLCDSTQTEQEYMDAIHLSQTVYEKDRVYWHQRMASHAEAPKLPTKKPLEQCVQQQLSAKQFVLSASISRSLHNAARHAGITITSLMYTCFTYVLRRWSNQEKFCISMLHANNRYRRSIDCKAFANLSDVSVISTQLDGNEALIDNIRQVHRNLQTDLAHSTYSGINCLRQINQSHQRMSIPVPVSFVSLLGLDYNVGNSMKLLDTGVQTPYMMLDCLIAQYNHRLHITWMINDECMDSRVSAAMLADYKAILNSVASDLTRLDRPYYFHLPVSNIAIRQAANANYPCRQAHRCLHDDFIEQARLHPQRTAIICQGIEYSYQQLHDDACRIAAHVIQSPDTLIAIQMDKSYQQIATLIGILFAGKAYLPLASQWPKARCARILASAKVNTILTASYIANCIATPILQEPVPSRFTDLAYVLYTSGTTGHPKGVAMQHSAVVNTIIDVIQRRALSEKSTFMMLSDASFDLSVFDIFAALSLGACCVIPTEDSKHDIERLSQLIDQYRVSVINAVPSMVALLCHQQSAPNRRVETVMMSGDWIANDLPGTVRQCFPAASVVSLGGATECAIWSIEYLIRPHDIFDRSIPYGKAMTHQSVAVIDQDGLPCPDYVRGEIAIGGMGLAREYWRQPDLTAERFIRNPHDGLRYFMTGDVGYYRDDGNIMIEGRKDNQLKISGYRVDINEIKACMLQSSYCNEVAVVTLGQRQQASLVGFYTSSNQCNSDVALRQYLRQRLADYMVPSQLVCIDAIPLSMNGKVDQQQLIAMLYEHMPTEYDDFDNDILNELQYMVAALLQTDVSVVTDNLFALGITSLHALQLSYNIDQRFNQRISMRELYAMGSIKKISARITSANVSSNASSIVSIAVNPGKPILVVVHPLDGLVNQYSSLCQYLANDFHIVGLQYDCMNADVLSIESISSKHIEQLKSMNLESACLIGWSYGGLIANEIAVQLESNGGYKIPSILIDSAPSKSKQSSVSALEYFCYQLVGQYRLEQLMVATDVQSIYQALLARKLINDDVTLHVFNSQFQQFERHYQAYCQYRPTIRADWAQALYPAASSIDIDRIHQLTQNTYTIPGDHYSCIHTFAKQTATCIQTIICRILESTQKEIRHV